ncbi:hypothetical protein LUZ62_044454 [Rhynchospora pubera]|uniref:Uncharacterized protein n=1 Tax=Rhynchospora pubera TaxID=906938 RepID=A0AAV8FR60_9POAL|nr:hypothetical protein LUZ62_044454 [Rhynchospora pubera]
MERGFDTLLDYAIFQTSSVQNRYDAIVCCKGETEKLVSGPLDPISLFLPDAKVIRSKSSNGTFKLQLKDVTVARWFNKSTLLRFLHAVNSPDMQKSAGGILNEMSQLEETRKFHLSIYSKDQNRLGGISGGFLDSVGMVQQVNAGTVTSEATKNELLRALDLRLTALNEELAELFSRAVSSNISSEELSYLASFVHHFCTPDLRDLISQNLETISNQHPNEQNNSNLCEPEPIKPINTTGVSPAKLAQVERASSSGSADENSSSGDEESETVIERSRPVMRAPSPRRSASPMRRVQIGRSGSRRAQAIAIKSLSYFPSRDRSTFDRGPDDSGEEEGDQSTKKTEVNVSRISVKDAISLFECKQKDHGGDANTKKTFGFVSTNKAVLRRWSSGMGESCTSQNTSTDFASEKNDSTNLISHSDEVEEVVKVEIQIQPEKSAPQEGLIEAPVSVTEEEMKSQHEVVSDKALASAEWNRQKEAELNEMLLKMMGTKPGKYGLMGSKPNDQKGELCSPNKEKGDVKLRDETNVKRVTKKRLQETTKRPAAVSKTAGAVKEKKISPIPQQRQPRRNSSPLAAPKKEASKATTPASSRKASPRASPMPSTRSSWSAGPIATKSNSSQKSKSGSILNSSTNSNTPISRRKPQVTPSNQPSPKTEKPIKTTKGSLTGPKSPANGQEEKKPKAAVKTSRVAKLKNLSSSVDESCAPTKPSLYNKVTKKSSVVPLETKPSLKKSSVPTKVKASAVASPKDSAKSIRKSQDNETPSPVAAVACTEVPEVVPAEHDHDTEVKVSPNDEPNVKEIENVAEVHLQATESSFPDSAHGTITSTEVQTEDDMGISSAAWVEEADQEAQVTSEIGEQTLDEGCPTVLESTLSSSPKIRHSLSQMLQADTHEPEIIEWGNAENPPALVFQKDSPKGFKRLLKFARKSSNTSTSSNKGEANSNGWASPSVFSEGEEDAEELKGVGGRNAGLLQTRGSGPQRFLSESFDGGFSTKRGIGSGKMNTIASAQSSSININSLNSDKLREGNAPSTKASRSFFSLSNFRSNRSNETKPR